MTLYDEFTNESDFDLKSTEQLKEDALKLAPMERARSLYALARRTTPASVGELFELLDHEQSESPLLFGGFPIKMAGCIALLLNSSGEVRERAEERWFQIPFIERDLIGPSMRSEGIDLPVQASEQATLNKACEYAAELLGEADWHARPTDHEEAVVVREHGSNGRSIIVAPDGSALLVRSASVWDELQRFVAGERSTAEDIAAVANDD